MCDVQREYAELAHHAAALWLALERDVFSEIEDAVARLPAATRPPRRVADRSMARARAIRLAREALSLALMLSTRGVRDDRVSRLLEDAGREALGYVEAGGASD